MSKKHHYHIVFKANHSDGRVTEHSRYVDLDLPIEYASDVQITEEWAAEQVNADTAMLTNWTLLKGHVRPEPLN